jgi:peptide-methionine (S)-S-oxide reductase
MDNVDNATPTGKTSQESKSPDSGKAGTSRIATFAAGCFWGVEETFRRTPGVMNTQVGYCGGATADPDYRAVCTGATGHAEAVEVEFDPAKVGFTQLAEIFWENHDPTTLNRQGPDVGTQYRSAIYYHGEDQKAEAQASKERRQASGKHRRPIVTEITPASAFYRAEEYHQRYLAKRGMDGCHL